MLLQLNANAVSSYIYLFPVGSIVHMTTDNTSTYTIILLKPKEEKLDMFLSTRIIHLYLAEVA